MYHVDATAPLSKQHTDGQCHVEVFFIHPLDPPHFIGSLLHIIKAVIGGEGKFIELLNSEAIFYECGKYFTERMVPAVFL